MTQQHPQQHQQTVTHKTRLGASQVILIIAEALGLPEGSQPNVTDDEGHPVALTVTWETTELMQRVATTLTK